MAFGNKSNNNNKSKGSYSNTKKKGDWKKVGSMFEKEGRNFVMADSYNGTLLYVAKAKDGSATGVYTVKSISFTDKETLVEKGMKKLPDSMVGALSVNLTSETAVKKHELDRSDLEAFEGFFEQDDNYRKDSENQD